MLQECFKHTGEKIVLVHPAVHLCSRAPFVNFIVVKPEIFNYYSMFVTGVLRHDIHWCQNYTWDSINLAQRKNQSITMDNIFLYQFSEKFGFLTALL